MWTADNPHCTPCMRNGIVSRLDVNNPLAESPRLLELGYWLRGCIVHTRAMCIEISISPLYELLDSLNG